MSVLSTAQASQNSTSVPPVETQAVSNPTYELDSRQLDIEDINVAAAEEDYSKYSEFLEIFSLPHYLSTMVRAFLIFNFVCLFHPDMTYKVDWALKTSN